MIGFIKGKLLSAKDGLCLIENNGLGFNINCSSSVYKKLVDNNGGEVYTYMAVKEDAISLYGFISPEEKEMFIKLISVSGVGPKMGITVLSNMTLTDLALKIAKNDVKGLSAVKGVGKKTAERIILELREKITAVEGEEPVVLDTPTANTEVNEDAVIALMSLGFKRNECVFALARAKENGANTIEELIAYSIKNMK